MSNEDKIIAMLESMQGEMGGIKSELLKTNIRIENEIIPKINLLCDGVASL